MNDSVGQILTKAGSYEELLAACIARRHELGLSQMAVDEISGLQGGYVGKLECGAKRLGPMSFPCLLQALGLELLVVRTTPHHERHRRQMGGARGRSDAGRREQADQQEPIRSAA